MIALLKKELNYSRDEILYKIPYTVLMMELISISYTDKEKKSEETEVKVNDNGRPDLNLF